jgi:hypothetical protein
LFKNKKTLILYIYIYALLLLLLLLILFISLGIEIDTIASFKRLKELVSELNDKEEKTKEGINVSEKLKTLIEKHKEEFNDLELNEDQTKLRRTEPFNESNDWYYRTVHLVSI